MQIICNKNQYLINCILGFSLKGLNVPFAVDLTWTFQFQAWISICWANFLCLDMFSSPMAQLHFYWCRKDLCELAYIYKAPSVKWHFTPCAFFFLFFFSILFLCCELGIYTGASHWCKSSRIPITEIKHTLFY